MIIPWQSLATLTISNTIHTPTLEEAEVQPGPEEGRLFILILPGTTVCTAKFGGTF